MSTTWICSQGHALLPLSVRVLKSNMMPDVYYVGVRIDGSLVGDDHIMRSEKDARMHADFLMDLWAGRLMPVFEAGTMYTKVEKPNEDPPTTEIC